MLTEVELSRGKGLRRQTLHGYVDMQGRAFRRGDRLLLVGQGTVWEIRKVGRKAEKGDVRRGLQLGPAL